MEDNEQESTIRRIGGYLHRVVPVVDGAGKVLNYALSPLMVEFRPRDMMQIIVGASVLAVPVAFTEETWNLGAQLPLANVLGLNISASFNSAVTIYIIIPILLIPQILLSGVVVQFDQLNPGSEALAKLQSRMR